MGEAGGSGKEPHEKKNLNDDFLLFISKRRESELPRYTASLKSYVDLLYKRNRAAATRRRNEKKSSSASRKKDVQDAPAETREHLGNGVDVSGRGRGGATGQRTRSSSRGSEEPCDRCCGRRRRRRRRRSCRRRRRRRRSCRRRRRRRSCGRRRRRRRRSCSRRRRRRSCRRRRRRRRRRRC